MRGWKLHVLAVSIVVVVVGGISACGDDDAQDGASDQPAEATDDQEVDEATGEPIVVAAIGDYTTPAGSENPEWHAAIEARAQQINETGGINGRPVDVFVCDSKFDANSAAQCAGDAVERDAVAVVGLLSSVDTVVLEVAAEAGIPVIGPQPIGPEITLNEFSFPIASGVPGVFTGLEVALVEQGSTRVAAIYGDNEPGNIAKTFFDSLADAQPDVTNNGVILAPIDTTDYSVAAEAAAANDTDGIGAMVIGDPLGALLTALTEATDATIITGATFLTSELIGDLGATLDEVLVVAQVMPATADTPGMRLFNDDMDAFDPSLPRTDSVIHNWLAMWVFENVAGGLETVDAASVLDAMSQIEDMDMGGITPPLTTTEEFTSPAGLPPLPRLFNPTLVVQRVEDGELFVVNEDEPFLDPFAGLGT